MSKEVDIVVLAPKGEVDTTKRPADVQRQLNARRSLMVDSLEVKHDQPIKMEHAKRASLHKIMTIVMGTSDQAALCGYPAAGQKPNKNAQDEADELEPVHPHNELFEDGEENEENGENGDAAEAE